MLYGYSRRNRASRFLDEVDRRYVTEVGEERKKNYLDRDYARANAFGSFYADHNGSDTAGHRGQPAGQRMQNRPEELRSHISTVPLRNSASEEVTYAPGDLVEHRMFGRGTVISVTKVGNDSLIDIRFDRVGRKKAMAKYAPMKKLEEQT